MYVCVCIDYAMCACVCNIVFALCMAILQQSLYLLLTTAIDATMFDVIVVVAGFRQVTVAQSTLYTATKECFRCIRNKKPSNEFVGVSAAAAAAASVACCSTFTLNPWR